MFIPQEISLPPLSFTVGLGVLLFAIVYYGSLLIYNIYFHPLSKYPGPGIAAVTEWSSISSYAAGNGPTHYLELHNQYGPVVRTGRNELSFINASQWKEIYGHRQAGQHEFEKDKKYHAGLSGDPTILNSNQEYHRYIRKLLAHGFSDKSLREQETVLQDYVNTMVQSLHEKCEDGNASLDLVSWYSFIISDFIGYLTFGETFDSLENLRVHPWLNLSASLLRQMGYGQAIARFPSLLQPIARYLVIPNPIQTKYKYLKQISSEKTRSRIQNGSSVTDFMDKLIEAHESGKITFDQLVGNAEILLVAGSDTTVTLLSGLTYLLLQYPEVREKLAREIRGAFQSPEEITIVGVNQCKYLFACIEEALRLYPPSPQPHQRVVPPGGGTVNGQFIPEGVLVSIPIYAAARSPQNWTQPNEFIPERWMGEDPKFQDDVRESFQPFSNGPRNCIGRNLAYVEMKVITARLMWHFDLESDTKGDWFDQKVYGVWEKKPLMVKLHPVKRGHREAKEVRG